jgi:hypothetical protein
MVRSQRDVPTYIAAANCFFIDHGDVGDFTKGIPSWWKSHSSEVGAWSEAVKAGFAWIETPHVLRVTKLGRRLTSNNNGANGITIMTFIYGRVEKRSKIYMIVFDGL